MIHSTLSFIFILQENIVELNWWCNKHGGLQILTITLFAILYFTNVAIIGFLLKKRKFAIDRFNFTAIENRRLSGSQSTKKCFGKYADVEEFSRSFATLTVQRPPLNETSHVRLVNLPSAFVRTHCVYICVCQCVQASVCWCRYTFTR